jgi:hypothetical protein
VAMDSELSLLRIQAVFAERGRGAMSLETRWMLPGPLPIAMIEWLGPFDVAIERREDQYLLNPSSEELGVKIKGAILLDLKVLRGSPGLLEIPQVGQGRLEIWEKWSFPADATGRSPGNASSWLTVQKVRRRRSFRLSQGQLVERGLSEAELPGCTLELTEIAIGEAAWWSLGIEAHGGSAPEAALHATVESLFRGSPPKGIWLEVENSLSYPRCLGTRS